MDKLVLLTYINRSGSTFLCQRLSAYTEILVMPEAETLIYSFLLNPYQKIALNSSFKESVRTMLKTDPKIKYWGLNYNSLLNSFTGQNNFDFFLTILELYRKKNKPSARIILFKGTRLINIIPLLLNRQNQVAIKVISLIRDPRAIYNSQRKTRNLANQKIMCDNPVLLSKYWDWYLNRLDSLSENPNLCQVLYEKMVLNTEIMEEEIARFLQLNSTRKDPKGDLFARIPANQMQNHRNVDDVPNQALIKQWKKNWDVNKYWIKIVQMTSRNLIRYYQPEKYVNPWNLKIIIMLLIFYIRFICYRTFSKYAYNRNG